MAAGEEGRGLPSDKPSGGRGRHCRTRFRSRRLFSENGYVSRLFRSVAGAGLAARHSRSASSFPRLRAQRSTQSGPSAFSRNSR